MNYLYNGVELPELPSVEYPYRYINTNADGMLDKSTYSHIFAYSNKPFYLTSDTGQFCLDSGAMYGFYALRSSDQTWESIGTFTLDSVMTNGFTAGTLVWCNTDVMNTTANTVFMKGTSPIPAAFTIDKTSFLAGYKAGAELRRLRMNKGESDSNYKHRIVWDCTDTEGKTSYNLADEYLFYKVSDLVPESDELIGGRLTVRASNGSETEEMIIDITADSFNPKDSAGYMAHYFIVRTSMEESFIYETPETGIWFVDLLSLPDAEGAVSGSIILEW